MQDDLATEARRTSLLDLIERQLKGRGVVSRLLFVFPVPDDRRIQGEVEKIFEDWLKSNDQSENLTGTLIFQAQAAIHFLEGPTESLFSALTVFQGMASEVAAGTGTPARSALIGPLRILYFTELHGVRTSRSWVAHHHMTKPMGGTVAFEPDNSSELIFVTYRKFLLLNLQVQQSLGSAEADAEKVLAGVKKGADLLPTTDEVTNFMSKNAAELLFSYAEFEKVFMSPFHTVPHSELLWPMPPPLSY